MKRQKTTQTEAITKEEDNMEDFNISECLDSSIFDEIEHVKIRNLNYLSSETCFGGINENAG